MIQFPGAELFAIVILVTGALFAAFWYLDHLTHLEIWRQDITDGELKTHRMILYASYALMLSLGIFAISPWLGLPIFVGAWITRTLHETIDEFKWHLPRCTERETLIHLVMWITIHAGTAATFLWGFFWQYEGFGELSIFYRLGFAVLFVLYSVVGHLELTSYKTRNHPQSRAASDALVP